MTGRTIASHDPDLAQTITDMAAACHRLALAEERIVLAHRADNAAHLLPNAVAHAGAIRVTIATRAARLNIKPFGLRLIIEEHERLRLKQGRRPTMEQLERAVEAAADQLARRAQADESYKCEAEFHARRSTQMAEASDNAVAYLRACA
jgi:hypothetical protein